MNRRAKRYALLATVAIAAASTALAILSLKQAETVAAADPPGISREWIPTVSSDGPEVFRRAFWRHPAADDRICNAERVEWKDAGGNVQRWQWFIELQPGPSLDQWLHNANAFSLQPASTFSTAECRVPEWFTAAQSKGTWKIWQNGPLTVMRDTAGNRLVAYASGFGFTAAARGS